MVWVKRVPKRGQPLGACNVRGYALGQYIGKVHMSLRKMRTKHSHNFAAAVLAATILAVPATAVVANAATNVPPSPVAADQAELVEVSDLPFETVLVEVETLPKDVEVVKQEGVDGVVHVYASRAHTNSAPVRNAIVVKEQTPRIIEVGTKFELPKVSEPEVVEPEEEPENANAGGQYSLSDLMFQGVINWNGYKFTYYSQSVLPGPGLAIPGRHVSGAGFVSDGAGNVVLAAGRGVPHGTTFSIPFGSGVGKVYDTCASCSSNWLDVYTQ